MGILMHMTCITKYYKVENDDQYFNALSDCK